MKAKLILPLFGLLVTAGIANAQIVTAGDFESGSDSSWTKWEELSGQTTLTYNYTADGPTGGSGGALRIESAGDTTNGGAYQEITLTGGNIYEVEGLVKEVAGDPESAWFEVFLSSTAPVDGSDAPGTNVTKVNTWNCDGYDGSFTAGCETPSNGEFTVPGTGSQTWYLILKSGVCCGGGPAEYLVDDIVVTDLGAAQTFDTPPTPLVEDFDDGDDVNNYGGEYRAFAGGDPGGNFTGQDDRMDAVSEDAQGTTGASGDYALHIFANTSLEGQSFIYYGGVCSIIPNEVGGQDLSGFDSVSFDIKLGNASSTTDWVVRLEDTSADNNNAGSYQYIDLDSQLSTTYASVTVPLDDFVNNADGGTIAPDLTAIDVIVFVGEDTTLLATDPDIYVDNLQLNAASSVENWDLY